MHGDVKPSNVMISPEGHVTLLDLNFARQRKGESGTAAERCVTGTFITCAGTTRIGAASRYPQRHLQSGGGAVSHFRRPLAV